MEWIQSEHRIKHELYNKKKGYINYNIYYCSNCGYSKVIKVGSQNKTKSCPLCNDTNIHAITLNRHSRIKSRLQRNNKNNDWKYNRKQYRYMLAEKLDYKCECCNNNFNLDELVIHHVKPHKGDVNLMHDFNNMLLCCPSCHTLIHKRLQYHDETNKSECWKAIRESMIIKRTY